MNRKKLEKPAKNHQKPPQDKPDLTWNGKRRSLEKIATAALKIDYVRSILILASIYKPPVCALRSFRLLRSLVRCVRVTSVSDVIYPTPVRP